MTNSYSKIPARVIALAIFVHVLWGANPIAIKFSLESFPPLWTAFLRFSIGAAFILICAKALGSTIWPQGSQWRVHWFGSALFGLQIAALNVGVDLTSASMGAILIATNPLFAALFSHFLVRESRLGVLQYVGVVVAMCGAAVTLMPNSASVLSGATTEGNLIVLGSALLLGFRLAFTARAVRTLDPMAVAFWQMTLALPAFLVVALFTENVDWLQVSGAAIGGVLYQGLVVAGAGFAVSYMLIRYYSPSVMFSFNFVSPISGVALGMLLLQEHVGASLYLGMFLVTCGLILVARLGVSPRP